MHSGSAMWTVCPKFSWRMFKNDLCSKIKIVLLEFIPFENFVSLLCYTLYNLKHQHACFCCVPFYTSLLVLANNCAKHLRFNFIGNFMAADVVLALLTFYDMLEKIKTKHCLYNAIRRFRNSTFIAWSGSTQINTCLF